MSDVLLAWDDGYGEREMAQASPEDVTACVGALNGVSKTLVTIYRGDGHLAVGGAATTGTIVYCTLDNEVFWQLVGDPDAEGAVAVCAGGQEGEYPSRFLVPVERAIEAANEFAATGARPLRGTWEQS